MNENQTPSNKNESFLKRFSFALKGVQSIWSKEASFRFQCYCALLLLVFCLIVQPPGHWCAIFTLSAIVVLTLECVNTSIEAMLDKLHPGYDPSVGFVKDCLAGAVLIASIGSVIIFICFTVTWLIPTLR